MKRNIVMIWALIAVLLLSACTQNAPAEPSPSVPPVFVDRATPELKTLDEYNRFVESCDYLPDNFVHYNALEMFGEFYHFLYYVQGTKETGPYLYYASTYLTDANDYMIAVKALYNVEAGGGGHIRYKEPLPFDETVADMRTHPSGENGTVYRDGINYVYYKGKLHQVVVIIDGLEIIFSEGILQARPYQYPVGGEDTPFARLLSADIAVASAVVEELAAKLAQ